MPKLTIDGIEVEVAPGTNILQAAEQIGIEIPRFCYHDRLSVPANCRMCLVEVAPGPPKPQASCALACADGMTVKTNSDMVHKARKGVMEMLLINHPLDCPICDQGGECDLQDQAMSYGFDRSRYNENKRAVKDKYMGPLIKTSMTRCIQCTRCIRFGEEIAGVPELGLLNRGENVEISTFITKAVESELSGNLIDVCPVGALLSKPYSFKARPWELRRTDTIDVHDAVGSNIRVDSRGNEVMRVLPRLHEGVNEEWISDKTRFAYDGLKKRRLDRPWIKKNGKLTEATWEEAFGVIAAKLKTLKPQNVLAMAGDLCAVEEMVALKDLLGNDANYACRLDCAGFDVSARGNYLFNSTIAGIEEADAILLVGTNPRLEATMVNARIRKTWLNKRVKVGLIGAAEDLTYPYTHIGTGAGDLAALASHPFAKVLENAKNPIIIAGMGAFRREDAQAVHALLLDTAEKYKAAFNMLHIAASRVGALDVGFFNTGACPASNIELVWLLGVDDAKEGGLLDTLPDDAMIVYQGHHGDTGAHKADVILPGAAYTEKDGLYVNMEGRVQMGRRAVSAPGQAREDWRIIRAFSDQLGRSLPYDDLFALRNRIVSQWPHLGQIDVISPASTKAIATKTKVMPLDFQPVYEDFFMTNAICRASGVMEKCAEVFTRPRQQALEAAE